jgi:hypothetical protein
MDMEKRSGVLIVQQDRHLGRLYVRQGRVLRAKIEGKMERHGGGQLSSMRRRSGQEAVYQMLTWARGQFELWQADVDGHDEVRTSTTFLLLEGMRRMDEAMEARHATNSRRGPRAHMSAYVGHEGTDGEARPGASEALGDIPF